jgi:hypothetical protein
VELNYVTMLCESEAKEESQVCMEVACTVLLTMVVLVLAKIEVLYVK